MRSGAFKLPIFVILIISTILSIILIICAEINSGERKYLQNFAFILSFILSSSSLKSFMSSIYSKFSDTQKYYLYPFFSLYFGVGAII